MIINLLPPKGNYKVMVTIMMSGRGIGIRLVANGSFAD
jgi:hypothetical protein